MYFLYILIYSNINEVLPFASHILIYRALLPDKLRFAEHGDLLNQPRMRDPGLPQQHLCGPINHLPEQERRPQQVQEDPRPPAEEDSGAVHSKHGAVQETRFSQGVLE